MSTRFNGAMTSQPWIRVGRISGLALIGKLQWSHDLSAMDTSDYTVQSIKGLELQWSHDLSAMDTTHYGSYSTGRLIASMEP